MNDRNLIECTQKCVFFDAFFYIQLRSSISLLIYDIEHYKLQFTCTIEQEFKTILQNGNHLATAFNNFPKDEYKHN